MQPLEKKYVIDDQERKVAVQIDVDMFEKIEETLENYGLVQLMNETDGDEQLSVEQAQSLYDKLEKSS